MKEDDRYGGEIMVIIGVPLEVAAKSSSTSSSEEQKLARGDLWKRPQLFKNDDGRGGKFHSLLDTECKKLGYDLSSGLHF